jgi:phosphoglycolate phosphatase-like HAD superfamily hydrolase
MHIVSGSDGTELRSLCNNLEIAKFFNSIHGSPTPKNQLISELLKINNYNPDHCVLIGDSINDFEAAELNDIKFFGYNNSKIKNLGDRYLTQFDDILDSHFLK